MNGGSYWKKILAAQFALNGLCHTPVFAVPSELPVIHWIKHVPVDSEAIKAIGYHYKTKTLEVQFASGETYRYASVPLSVYKAFLAADSKGHFFRDRVRGQFDYWKVESK